MNFQVSFTTGYRGLHNKLINEVRIGKPFNPSLGGLSQSEIDTLKSFKACWDTGATNSVIKPNIANECNLSPIGMGILITGGGQISCNRYIISLWLPNKVVISDLVVLQSDKIQDSDFDLLIGMDVMNRGDFALSNYNGITTFSFRWPSQEMIDFTKRKKNFEIQNEKSLCPCGSGKLFSDCHGKLTKNTKRGRRKSNK